MKKSLGLLLISLGAGATLVGAAKWRESREMAGPDLAPLDKAMQVRFEVPEGFGMGRLAGERENNDHTRTPTLSSAAAYNAARDLRAQGWDVNFYLGGRELLDPNRKNRSLARQQSSLGLINQPFRDLRGPVALMPSAQQNAPDRDEISAQAKLALEVSGAGLSQPRWSMAIGGVSRDGHQTSLRSLPRHTGKSPPTGPRPENRRHAGRDRLRLSARELSRAIHE